MSRSTTGDQSITTFAHAVNLPGAMVRVQVGDSQLLFPLSQLADSLLAVAGLSLPTSGGTYILKVSDNGGSLAYEWEESNPLEFSEGQ